MCDTFVFVELLHDTFTFNVFVICDKCVLMMFYFQYYKTISIYFYFVIHFLHVCVPRAWLLIHTIKNELQSPILSPRKLLYPPISTLDLCPPPHWVHLQSITSFLLTSNSPCKVTVTSFFHQAVSSSYTNPQSPLIFLSINYWRHNYSTLFHPSIMHASNYTCTKSKICPFIIYHVNLFIPKHKCIFQNGTHRDCISSSPNPHQSISSYDYVEGGRATSFSQ
jgi:hypothetical protein